MSPAATYRPRHPEHTAFYQCLEDYWEEFQEAYPYLWMKHHQDPADHPRVLDEGDDAHGASASRTDYLTRCGLWTFSAFVVEDGQLSSLHRPGKESQRS